MKLENSCEMSNNLELVEVTPQKHDPAWKHCQMFKNGEKMELKCIYCGKVFKGGGIHRIKEHLAGQKGNAATCLSVESDVRAQMLESLNGVAARKRKKQKLTDEVSGFDNQVDGNCGTNTEFDLIPMPEHDNGEMYENGEDDVSKKGGKKKKRRVRKPVVVANSNLAPLSSRKWSNEVHMAIGRFFVDVGLPLEAANSAYFQPMIDAISSQGEEGGAGPSYHDLRGSVSKDLFHEVRNDVSQCSLAWGRTGCSILVTELNSGKGKTFLNFSVYSPEGTIFLRSVDISHALDCTETLCEILRDVIEEVGLTNVLQVITNNEDRYVIAANRLIETYPTVFFTTCAGQCIDLILEDIGKLPKVKRILDQAKSISQFIYSNSVILNMLRRYTYGIDLIDIGNTRSSTDFMTLKRIVNIKYNLQSMFTSEEWMESPWSKETKGFEVLDCVSDHSFWSDCTLITNLTDPLVRLSRIVRSEKRPAMGYVFAGLYRAKETIKKELVAKEEYSVYLNLINRRWDQLHQNPLHAAGFYLNPIFFYSLEDDAHIPIRSSVYDCIEKLVSDPDIQDKIMQETTSYHGCVGDFGRKLAIRARQTSPPTEWWLKYGGACPNLSRFAIQILSQTCSLIQHQPNKIRIEQMHERKNCLEHQRLSDLVFIQHNMAFKQQSDLNKKEEKDPISYDNIDVVEDWVVEKELFTKCPENADWMAIDPPPVGDVTQLGQVIDDIEALGTGFNDYEIFDGVKDNEEENDDENVQIE